MNRREVLASMTALAGTALVPERLAPSEPQITHVESKLDGSILRSKVVKKESLHPEGAAPGAKAFVHFNGPTQQLAALTSGLVTLQPGAQPHPPHRHPEEEIMIVGEGSGEFSIDGMTTQVKAGDMVFAESNVLHGVLNTGQTRMVFYFIKTMGRCAS